MPQLTIPLSPPYHITIKEGLLRAPYTDLQSAHDAQPTVILSDTHVATHYARSLSQQLNCPLLVMPAGDQHKTREQKAALEDELFNLGCLRDTHLLAVGGGVVCDMAGFIAATFCRGIDVSYVPTSALAMVDASIGGKTAVNTPHGKNLIGAFKQPHQVWIDPQCQRTLLPIQRLDGWVETIKHAIIADADFFSALPAAHTLDQTPLSIDVIQHSIQIKSHVVCADVQDHHHRHVLNFGHTIGHALEHLSHYQLSHGHAVALGMIVEAALANRLGLLAASASEQIIHYCQQLPYPDYHINSTDCDAIIKRLRFDKKAQQQQPRFALPAAIGTMHQHNATYSVCANEHDISQALQLITAT